MSNKEYDIIKTPKKTKSIVRVKLNTNSAFPGVIIDYTSVKLLEGENVNNGSNATLIYNIVKVPKGKYENLEDIDKDTFDKTAANVFIDIMSELVKAENLAEKFKNTEKNIEDIIGN